MSPKSYRLLCLFTTLLAFGVIVLGAYTRLTDAGLGCPDWPGCYGHLLVPEHALEAPKAWTEMIHRYAASSLGLFILIIAFLNRHKLSFCLLGLVVAQGLLGMWTVTLKLHPTIVMAHLLGGLTILSLLTWLTLQAYFPKNGMTASVSRGMVSLGLTALIVLAIQIALGGWTSSNYAALACPDFPTCQNQWLPPLDFKQAFHLAPEVGLNYEGGLLHNTPRVTIHVMHRLGALCTTIVLFILTLSLWCHRQQDQRFVYLAVIILSLLITQVGLGITNVLAWLPLSIAVAHNAVAALLLVSLIVTNFFIYKTS